VVTDFRTAIEVLADSGVEFVIVGGLAATVHGSARLTQDLDVVYHRTPENLRAAGLAGRPKDLEVIAELEALLEESKPSR
jgi:hypothetical protein